MLNLYLTCMKSKVLGYVNKSNMQSKKEKKGTTINFHTLRYFSDPKLFSEWESKALLGCTSLHYKKFIILIIDNLTCQLDYI